MAKSVLELANIARPGWDAQGLGVASRGCLGSRAALDSSGEARFWRFDLVVLKKIARLKGLDFDHLSDEFDLCWRLAAAIPGTEDEDTLLHCMHERIRSMRATAATPTEFMEFEETEYIMHTEDSDDFKVQKTHKATQARLKEFLAPYKQKRQTVAKARAKAAAGRGAGKKGGGKKAGKGRGCHPWGDRKWPL